jgi:hypothetical protein
MLGHLFQWVDLNAGPGVDLNAGPPWTLMLGRDSVSFPNPVLDIFGGVS